MGAREKARWKYGEEQDTDGSVGAWLRKRQADPRRARDDIFLIRARLVFLSSAFKGER
jgi:hypothetical protein